jgi:hypothetical protein
MSRSQDIAREMEAARRELEAHTGVESQLLAGPNGIDILHSTPSFSRLREDVAPVVTGQGSYTRQYTPPFSEDFWLGVVIGAVGLGVILMAIAFAADFLGLI